MLIATTVLLLLIVAYLVFVGALQNRSRISDQKRNSNDDDGASNTDPTEIAGDNKSTAA